MRRLNESEKELYLSNRTELHRQLSELQADFEDLTNDQLIEFRGVMHGRVNDCLELILETDEDNENEFFQIGDPDAPREEIIRDGLECCVEEFFETEDHGRVYELFDKFIEGLDFPVSYAEEYVDQNDTVRIAYLDTDGKIKQFEFEF